MLAGMDLPLLRTFRTVAREKSLTGAARVLGVSQPTVSVAIKNLEEELRTTLLVRTRSGVELTATGELLLERADGILALVSDTTEAIRDLETDDVGTFTFGCYESLGAYFLPGFLRDFLPRHPGVALQLWNGSSASVRQAILDRTVDIGLVVNCESHPDLVIIDVFGDVIELVAVGPTAGGDLESARARVERGPLVWCDRPVFRALVNRLTEMGAGPHRTLVCGDLELVKSLVLSGLGVGMLPRRVARYGNTSLQTLHPDLPHTADRIHLVYRGDVHRTRAARTLKEALVAYGRSLGD